MDCKESLLDFLLSRAVIFSYWVRKHYVFRQRELPAVAQMITEGVCTYGGQGSSA